MAWFCRKFDHACKNYCHKKLLFSLLFKRSLPKVHNLFLSFLYNLRSYLEADTKHTNYQGFDFGNYWHFIIRFSDRLTNFFWTCFNALFLANTLSKPLGTCSPSDAITLETTRRPTFRIFAPVVPLNNRNFTVFANVRKSTFSFFTLTNCFSEVWWWRTRSVV